MKKEKERAQRSGKQYCHRSHGSVFYRCICILMRVCVSFAFVCRLQNSFDVCCLFSFVCINIVTHIYVIQSIRFMLFCMLQKIALFG